MAAFTFWIPLKVRGSEWGLNEIYSQAKFWAVRKRQAEQMHMIVKAAIRKKDRNVKPFKKPVIITIWYDSRLDIDNHGYLAKLLIDGMKGVLIEDDNRKHVRGLCQFFHDDGDVIYFKVEESRGNRKSSQ